MCGQVVQKNFGIPISQDKCFVVVKPLRVLCGHISNCCYVTQWNKLYLSSILELAMKLWLFFLTTFHFKEMITFCWP